MQNYILQWWIQKECGKSLLVGDSIPTIYKNTGVSRSAQYTNGLTLKNAFQLRLCKKWLNGNEEKLNDLKIW